MNTKSYNKVGFPQGSSLSAFPIGTVIQSPFGINDPNWIPLTGGTLSRSAYPLFAKLLPQVGVFTPTIRSGATVPNTGAIATNGTNLVAPGSGGTTAIQYSTNGGVNWSSATTPSGTVASLINAGTNFFATSSAGGMISPSSAGSGTWTASTGTAVPAATTCAANGSGTVIVPSGNIYQSTNYGSSFGAAFNGANSGSPASATPIVWTGSLFALFTAKSVAGQGFQTSTTGSTGTWTASFSMPWGALTVTSAASDGNGNILAVVSSSTIAYTSKDNGTTWKSVVLPAEVDVSANAASYANGRWFVSLFTPLSSSSFFADGSMAVSADMSSWALAQPFGIPDYTSNVTNMKTVSYAGGNYCCIDAAGNIVTLTENTSQMYMPMTRRLFSLQNAAWQEWIKVT